MGNKIGKERLAKLQEIMRAKPNLVSLCGIADDATEADLSGLGMDADDAAILASELPDKGAMSSANLLGNQIGIDQAKALATILKGHSTLKSLCGNRGDETELDMSGKEIGVEGAIMLAPEIIDNGALSHFNVSGNSLGSSGIQSICGSLLGDARFVCSVAVDYWTLLHCLLHAWCILITFPDQNRVLCALSYVTTRTYDSMLS
jgi:hypothetical protein